jgi:hypothetical protein
LEEVRCLLMNAPTSKEFVRPILNLKNDQCLRICLFLHKWCQCFEPPTSKFVFARLARKVCSEDIRIYIGSG